MTAAKLGAVQMRIMQVLWDRGQATAREITDDLNKQTPKEPIAHSTVQTLLRGLMDKGSAKYKKSGRAFIFMPAIAEKKVRKTATSDLVKRVFGGNAGDLVSFLLKNEKVSKQELDELKKLISEQIKKQ